jgi:hypothetical protein
LEKVVSEKLSKYKNLKVMMRMCKKKYRIKGNDVDLEKKIKILINVMGLK